MNSFTKGIYVLIKKLFMHSSKKGIHVLIKKRYLCTHQKKVFMYSVIKCISSYSDYMVKSLCSVCTK